jgi:hypothetical protein
MLLTLQFEFEYPFEPAVSLRVRAPGTGRSRLVSAYIDTGADRTVLDQLILHDIGLEPTDGQPISLMGLGGFCRRSIVLDIELLLLDQEALFIRMPVAFAARQATQVGNLLGLDLFQSFDLGIPHRQRLGYPGRAPA